MKILNYLLVFILLCTSACNKDDDNNCIKDENYFIAEFDEETLEPYWHTGFATKHYTLMAQRNPENQDDWHIYFNVNDSKTLFLWIKDINGIGSYPIDTGTIEDVAPPLYGNTYISLKDLNISDPNINNGSPYIYFSLGETGTIEIKEYDRTKGILIGTFSCMMYSTHNEGEVKEITGEFNINLATHNRDNKPCWL